MRVELPTRIPLTKTVIFASALFAVQQFEHTELTFSLLFFAFLILANIAFNVGGGFSRVSGAYVLLFAVLTGGLGVTWKAVVGEPADSNLLVPQLTMGIYTASMFMLLMVIIANKKLTGDQPGIATGDLNYTLSALGCFVLGTLQVVLNELSSGGSGSLLSVVNQLSQFYPLAMILGTIGAIKDSNGRKSVSPVSGLAMIVSFALGTLSFSKQGMFIPMACWLISVLFCRFRLRVVHFIVLGVFALFAFKIAPLIAEGRNINLQSQSMLERVGVVYEIFTHLQQAQAHDEDIQAHDLEVLGRLGYYNSPQGLIARLTMISVDDTLFNYSAKGHYIGYSPIVENYENWIPHFLLPEKPVPPSGNYYAHEVGGYLAEDDDSTGISFSPMAEAFHIDGWTGIFLLMPAIWFSLFASVDYICGDLRRAPWGLLMVVVFAHSAPESLLGGLIWLSGYGNLGLIVAIIACTQFTPVIGALFYGGSRLAERASPPLSFPEGHGYVVKPPAWKMPSIRIK